MRFLFLLFMVLLPLVSSQALRWENKKVKVVLGTEEILFDDYEKVRLIGIDAPDISFHRKQDACYSRSVFRYLKLLEGVSVKVLRDGVNRDFVHVKLNDGQKLNTVLLSRGMAKLKANSTIRYFKEYQKAAQEAKTYHRGLWEHCGVRKYFRLRQKMGTAWRIFAKKYGSFLAPVSVGRVQRVFSGNRFQLENGLTIRLLGLEVPKPSDDRAAYVCFGMHSKTYLESLILGERVFLRRDLTDIDENRELPRYVYVPKNRKKSEIFVNEKMIQDGYAQYFEEVSDVYFKKGFVSAQEAVYGSPNGAWARCRHWVDGRKADAKSKSLVYDEACRIKGNISGLKKSPVKTFHTPRSSWYKRVVPEQCFDTERAAEGAGFRKVK